MLKTLKKPYLGVFLSSIILFSSCSNPNNLEELEILTIEEYAKKHISLTDKIAEIFSVEDNINMETLSKSPENFNNTKEFVIFLKSANFSKSSQIANLYVEIQNNTNNFIKSLANLNQEEIIHKITVEINRQLNNDNLDKVQTLNRNTCESAFISGRQRCQRNYAISVAALAISGFFTFGVGTAIGAGAALTIFGLCMNDNSNDFAACLNS